MKRMILLLLFCRVAWGIDTRFGPTPIPLVSSTTPFSTTIASVSDSVAVVFQMNEPDTITDCGFKKVSGTGTNTMQVSVQGVTTATGLPDGTIKNSGDAKGSQAFIDGAGDGAWQWLALTTPYVAGRGELLSEVVQMTIDGGSVAIGSYVANLYANRGIPYIIPNGSARSEYPVIACKSSTRTYGGLAFIVAAETAFSSNSTPDEQGVGFSLPASLFATYKVCGVSAVIDPANSGKTINVTIYSGTTAIQGPLATFSDVEATLATGGRIVDYYFQDANLTALVGGSTYRIAFAPQQTATSLDLYNFTFADSLSRSSYPGAQYFYSTSRTDAGAWTDDTSSVFSMQLIICADSDITPPGGGGSFTFAQ